MASYKLAAALVLGVLCQCGAALGSHVGGLDDHDAAIRMQLRTMQQPPSAAAAAAASGPPSGSEAAAAAAVSNLGYSTSVFMNWYNYYIQHGYSSAAAAAAAGVASWAQHNGIPTGSSQFFNLTNAAANGYLHGGSSGSAAAAAAAAESEGFNSSQSSAAAAAASNSSSAAAAAASG